MGTFFDSLASQIRQGLNWPGISDEETRSMAAARQHDNPRRNVVNQSAAEESSADSGEGCFCDKCSTAGDRDADPWRVLRLSFRRNQMAVVQSRGARVLVARRSCERWAQAFGFFPVAT